MQDMVMIRRDLCNRLVDVAEAITGTIVEMERPGTPAIDRLALAKALLRFSAQRERSLPGKYLGEPSWFILLDLYVARAERRQVGVSSACIAAMGPATTALRALTQLTTDGMVQRTLDPVDTRRVYVSLTDAGYAAVDAALGRWRME